MQDKSHTYLKESDENDIIVSIPSLLDGKAKHVLNEDESLGIYRIPRAFIFAAETSKEKEFRERNHG